MKINTISIALLFILLFPQNLNAERESSKMELTLYHYKANIVLVYDGDTIRADIDLGMNIWD